MKKITFLTSCLILCMGFSAKAQLKVSPDGSVAIGPKNYNGYKLTVEGSVRLSNWTDIIIDWTNPWYGPCFYTEEDRQLEIGKTNKKIGTIYTYQLFYDHGVFKYSDIRLKTDIKPIKSPTQALKDLSCISYILENENKDENFDAQENDPLKVKNHKKFMEKKKEMDEKRQYGLIAQEVEQSFPELVSKPEGSEFLAVDYVGFIPVLISALKEQQNAIEDLQKEVLALRSQIDGKSKIGINNISSDTDIPQLFQNTPNPFTSETEIKYYIPQKTTSAKIMVYDMQGKEIATYPINSVQGEGILQIKGSELKAGMYMYSFLVNNQLVDTKKMILTK